MPDPLNEPVTDDSDGLDDRLEAALPAMIADATAPLRDQARRMHIELGWIAGVNWALTKMREGVDPLDVGIVALNHYRTLAPR